jgi:hypothetical protein
MVWLRTVVLGRMGRAEKSHPRASALSCPPFAASAGVDLADVIASIAEPAIYCWPCDARSGFAAVGVPYRPRYTVTSQV